MSTQPSRRVPSCGQHAGNQRTTSIGPIAFQTLLPVEFQQLEGAYLPPDFWANVKAEAQQTLSRFEADLRGNGVEVESVVREGYAATAIVEEAAEIGADLIVIGTHGLSGLKHMLLGSIAERVVQKAPCPVLTVKPCRSH